MAHSSLEVGFFQAVFLAVAVFTASLASVDSSKEAVKIPIKALSQGKVNDPFDPLADSGYVAEIQVGTPGQKFNVSLSTSDISSWLTSRGCESPSCLDHSKFASEKSTSFEESDQRYYLKLKGKDLFGLGGKDVFDLGGIQVFSQTFVRALQVDAAWYSNAKYDGYLALGLGKDGYVSNLLHQDPLAEPVFTIWFNPSPAEWDTFEGELALGQIERNKYSGELSYAQVEARHEWIFKIDQVATTGPNGTVCAIGCNAIIDTEISEIQGPTASVDVLLQSLGATYRGGKYIFADCKLDQVADVVFTLGGKQFNLKAEQYILQEISPNGDKICTSRIIGTGLSLWRLGDAFLRPHYMVFDYYNRQIGIAPAV